MLPPDEVVLLDVAVLEVDGLLLEVEGLLLDVVVLEVDGLDDEVMTLDDGFCDEVPPEEVLSSDVLSPLSGSFVSLMSPEVPVEVFPSDTV